MTRLGRMLPLLLVLMCAGFARADDGVAPGNTVFGRDVVISETFNGSLEVYGGDVTVRAPITGDLLVVGGKVTFEDGGGVAGDLIYTGPLREAMARSVSGRIYPLASLEGASASMRKSAVTFAFLFLWMVGAIVLTLINAKEVRYSSSELRLSPGHTLLVGLVALTSFLLSAIVFSMLVPYLIGIPLLAALGVFALLAKIYGMVAVFHALGTVVAGAKSREELARRRWLRGDIAMIAVGLLILGAIRLIPVVGTIVWSFASVVGVGVALSTRFGRREPWFLAFRAAEA